jgi:hypothetical protein
VRDVKVDGGAVSFTVLYQVETVTPKLVWPKEFRPEQLRKVEKDSARVVMEKYTISSEGVACEQAVGMAPPQQRFVFPAMVWDGARDITPTISRGEMTVCRAGGELNLSIASPQGLKLALTGPKLATHNGYVQAAVAELPNAGEPVRWKVILQPAPLK